MDSLFADLKVIDAAAFVAAPCAATIFADYGADVIKVEPLSGDKHRFVAAGHPSEWSWQLTDRSKRGLAMDFTSEEGYAVLMEMVANVDVLIVNFSASQLLKLKLDWETLKTVNPRLILAQVTAYGTEGPDADRKAFDMTGWFARSGILDFMHEKDVPPSPPANGVGDHATGMALYAGILTALIKREKTGEGSLVTSSLSGCGTWANGMSLQSMIAGIDNAGRRDKEGWTNPVSNVYTTKDDRYILISIQSPAQTFGSFAKALGKPEWLDDEQMNTIPALFKNRFAAREKIAAAVAEIDAKELGKRLDEAGLVYSLVHRNSEVINDEHLIANNVIVPFDSGKPGCDRTFPTPFNLSTHEQKKPQAAPELGQHSREVLSEFGLGDERIDALVEQGIVKAQSNDSGVA